MFSRDGKCYYSNKEFLKQNQQVNITVGGPYESYLFDENTFESNEIKNDYHSSVPLAMGSDRMFIVPRDGNYYIVLKSEKGFYGIGVPYEIVG